MNKIINIFKRNKAQRGRKHKSHPHHDPVIIQRSDHSISRKLISENALKVLYRLNKSGYQAYLVGGCVRDMMLGHEPKDFDIATDASPEQVRKIFRNCRLIGKRFRLAHVYFKREIIEVATFRTGGEGTIANNHRSHQGMVLRDNIYGTLEDDVWRRDFTVNALYYNIADFSVVDYTGGAIDLNNNVIRMIGDPAERYREDPVRMLRAIRFAAKLSFNIEEKTEEPIVHLAHLLEFISNARLYDESIKLFLSGHAAKTFTLLRQYQLFKELFPLTDECLNHPEFHYMTDTIIMSALNNTDQRIAEYKSVTTAFLYATLLWCPLQLEMKELMREGLKPNYAFEKAENHVIAQQAKFTAVPKRTLNIVREIWSLQQQLVQRHGRKPMKILHYQKFRAAYDFLLLRADADPDLLPIAQWWTQFQKADQEQQNKMLVELKKERLAKRTKPRQ